MNYQSGQQQHKGQIVHLGGRLTGITIRHPRESRRPVRAILAFIVAALALGACSPSAPPQGRWEGTYESGDTMVVARLETSSNGQVRISLPDIVGVSSDEVDRTTTRDALAERLAGGWGEVGPRPMDFDGTTFRKPGGIAPQIDFDKSTNTMTVYVYLGTAPAILVPLHAVAEFRDNPWPH